jgi:predicted dehydrogenase
MLDGILKGAMMNINRREFLERGVQGTMGATLAMSEVATTLKATPASDKVVLGVIGTGGRGSFVSTLFASRPDVEIAYVCDVHPERLEKGQDAVAKITGKKPEGVTDFRRVLDDKRVDAIYTATPHHWHGLITIAACQAGKDVYVEKPACHNVWEGQKMVEAARKYNRVVQVGTQNRSSSYGKSARELVQSGKLGDIHLVRVFNMFSRPRLESLPDSGTPGGMNWDMWLGPAPQRPYNQTWFRHWLYFWDFSGGLIEDDAVHQFDLARMVFNREFPTSVNHAGGNFSLHDAAEVPDTSLVTYEYDGMTVMIEQTWWAPYMKKTPESIRESETAYPEWFPFNDSVVQLYGTQGMMLLGRHGGGWQLFDGDGHKIGQEKQTHLDMQKAHVGNFVECIRSRQRPNADIEIGYVSSAICHLANVSYRAGNRKLYFDANTGRFSNDAEADRFLTRIYREPWVVPNRV